MHPPFRNSHKVDAFSTTVIDGTDQTFVRRILGGRARQAIWLKRIHHHFSLLPYDSGDGDQFTMIQIFQAGPTAPVPTGSDVSPIETNLFSQFSGGQVSYRNRQGIIDAHRVSIFNEAGAAGQLQRSNTYEFSQEYDLLIPGLYSFSGFVASSIGPQVESFTRVEYEWVPIALGDVAALQFDWGLDPVDFDNELHNVAE